MTNEAPALEPIEGFNPEQVTAELNQRFDERLKGEGISPEDQSYLLGFILQFSQIAVQQILQQRVIEVPQEATTENFSSLPYNGITASQTMSLFCEGVYYAVLKGWKMGVPQEFHTQLAGTIAQHVFDTTKQLILSTQGQELTPEHQITEEQQIAYVNQTAESALLYYVNEYEKTNGPFEPESRGVESDDETALTEVETVTELPIEPPEAPVPQEPQMPAGSRESHAKYAALALLLTTLKPKQQQALFQQFSPEEQQVINYYASPQNVERVLDITIVTQHLMALKEKIKSKAPVVEERTIASRAIEEMTQLYPKENLIGYVSHERPEVKHYLESSFVSKDAEVIPVEALFVADYKEEVSHPSKKLSSKVESVLHRFLSQHVN